MTYFVVLRKEYQGWECDGHEIPYIVAAHTEEEARGLFPPDIDDCHDQTIAVWHLALPDLTRRKKPFIAL